MLIKEQNYDFRKRLVQPHKRNIRDNSLIPNADELELTADFTISISGDMPQVLRDDFKDYLRI